MTKKRTSLIRGFYGYQVMINGLKRSYVAKIFTDEKRARDYQLHIERVLTY
jgi:hypothetical protein